VRDAKKKKQASALEAEAGVATQHITHIVICKSSTYCKQTEYHEQYANQSSTTSIAAVQYKLVLQDSNKLQIHYKGSDTKIQPENLKAKHLKLNQSICICIMSRSYDLLILIISLQTC
jgi:hypothetical protein